MEYFGGDVETRVVRILFWGGNGCKDRFGIPEDNDDNG